MLDATRIVGSHDILFITLDTLRFDVAQAAFQAGEIPNLARHLPSQGWELRHSPGSFTYAAHQAFFAGFLPTPAKPGRHQRLFALRFPGSETTGAGTHVFDAPTIIDGFASAGYHTVCIGGVGFFNLHTPLGRTMPGLFHERHWETRFGVTEARSTEYQVNQAIASLSVLPRHRRAFTFINVAALHQPNCMYLEGARCDSKASQQAALAYVDRELGRLFRACETRAPTLCIVCSDHGTAYGDDGYEGHRNGHPSVWQVPYNEWIIPQKRPQPGARAC